MFYEVIQMGFENEDTSISHDEAMQIVIGGFIKFLCDYKKTKDLTKCEKHLYCISKAATALREKDRRIYSTLLGLTAAMDPNLQDYSFVLQRVSEILGVDSTELASAIDSMNCNEK